jgi:CRISPR-associated protein Cas1
MPSLYVLETGSRLEIEYERLLVTLADEVILRVPLDQVSQVVLVGRVGATTPALHALLEKEIPLFFLAWSGKLLGRLAGPASLNVELRRAQYRRDDQPDFCLKMGRAIVTGKIRNQYTLAARWLRRAEKPTPPELAELRAAQVSAGSAASLESLLGIEGSAARAYFDIFQGLFAPEWEFNNRNRRPPKDPVNALLGLGYTLLHCSLTAALERVGLDPFLGYFHSEAYGRPALSLDLEEEFRAPLVDSLVLTLIRKRMLTPEDFHKDEYNRPTRLNGRCYRLFFKQFNQKINSTVTVPAIGRPLSYQKLFEVQARGLAKVVMGTEADYLPFRVR